MQIYKADIVTHLMEPEDINLKVVLSRRKFHSNKTEAIYTDNTGPVVAFEKLGKFPIVCWRKPLLDGLLFLEKTLQQIGDKNHNWRWRKLFSQVPSGLR